jgi:hypothetical protein
MMKYARRGCSNAKRRKPFGCAERAADDVRVAKRMLLSARKGDHTIRLKYA